MQYPTLYNSIDRQIAELDLKKPGIGRIWDIEVQRSSIFNKCRHQHWGKFNNISRDPTATKANGKADGDVKKPEIQLAPKNILNLII